MTCESEMLATNVFAAEDFAAGVFATEGFNRANFAAAGFFPAAGFTTLADFAVARTGTFFTGLFIDVFAGMCLFGASGRHTDINLPQFSAIIQAILLA
jgi:hypothetical protein